MAPAAAAGAVAGAASRELTDAEIANPARQVTPQAPPAGVTVEKAGDGTQVVTVEKPVLVPELPPKKAQLSDTIRMNVVVLGAMWIADWTGFKPIQDLVQQHPQEIMTFVNVANIFLRSKTNQSIKWPWQKVPA